MVGLLAKAAQPEPEPDEQDAEPVFDPAALMPAIERFRQAEYGGFDDLNALALAWNKVSPSEVRERWVKKGATRQEILDYFLPPEEAAA